jgi:DNA-binding CsgD family transcriptional regulator
MVTIESREASAVGDLTDRQAECLRLTADGLSSKQIGRVLGISPSTVDNHIHAAVAKLNAKNRWEAALLLHPERTNPSQVSLDGSLFLPPLGGRPNETPSRGRMLQIISIAIVSLILVAAVTASIVGLVYVFSVL